MKALKVYLVGAVLALLTACTNLQQLQASPPGTGGTEFTRALAQQYRTFAAEEWNGRADFGTSEWFAAKALRVNAGEAVPPEALGAWNPSAEVATDLAEARACLKATFGATSQAIWRPRSVHSTAGLRMRP